METFRTPQLQLIHNVLELAKNINSIQKVILREFNISHEQLNILIILFYDSSRPSISLLEIQKKMILSTTNTSRLLDNLKEKKLVTRKTNPINRRKVKIRITEEGENIVSQVMEKIKYNTERVDWRISDEETINIGKRINEINDFVLDWY